MIVSVVTAPALEPIAVEELETELRLDPAERGLLAKRAIRARRAIEQWTGHRLITQTVTVAGLCVEDGVALLPVVPVQALLSVVSAAGETGTAYTVAPADLTVMPDGYVFGFPDYITRASLTVRVGYGSNRENVPEDFVEAIVALVGQWSEFREAVAGGMPGQGSAPPAELPFSVRDIVAARRLVRLR